MFVYVVGPIKMYVLDKFDRNESKTCPDNGVRDGLILRIGVGIKYVEWETLAPSGAPLVV